GRRSFGRSEWPDRETSRTPSCRRKERLRRASKRCPERAGVARRVRRATGRTGGCSRRVRSIAGSHLVCLRALRILNRVGYAATPCGFCVAGGTVAYRGFAEPIPVAKTFGQMHR